MSWLFGGSKAAAPAAAPPPSSSSKPKGAAAPQGAKSKAASVAAPRRDVVGDMDFSSMLSGNGGGDDDMMLPDDGVDVEQDEELLAELNSLSGGATAAAAAKQTKAAKTTAAAVAAAPVAKVAAATQPKAVAQVKTQVQATRAPALAPETERSLDEELKAASSLAAGDDDDNVELTEDDMNDPELLSQLAAFGGDVTPVSSATSAANEAMAATPSAAASTRAVPVDDSMVAEPYVPSAAKPVVSVEQKLKTANVGLLKQYVQEEKQNALKLKRDGDIAGAQAALTNMKRLQARADQLAGAQTASTVPAVAAPVANKANAATASSSAPVAKSAPPKAAEAKKPAPAAAQPPSRPTTAPTGNTRPMVKSTSLDDTDMVPLQDLPRDEAFKKMESMLTSQIAACQAAKARFHQLGDTPMAVFFHKEQKAFVQDLEHVKAAQAKNAPLPNFHYSMRTYSMQQSFPDIPEHELEVAVVRGISLVPPPDYTTLDTFVTMELVYPNETVQAAQTEVVRGLDPAYNFVKRLRIDRTKSFQRFAERKKVSFQLMHSRGFLRGTALIGKASVDLKDLLTRCEIIQALEVRDDNRRPKGGKIEVRLRLRTPLLGPEFRDVSEKFLILDDLHPEEKAPGATASTVPGVIPSVLATKPAPAQPPAPAAASAAKPSAAAAAAKAAHAPTEDDDDEEDAYNLDWYVSSAVIEKETERVKTVIETLVAKKASVSDDLVDRQQQLDIKTNLLTIQVQTGQLSMDQYIAMVKQAVADEKKRALTFKKANKLDHAKAALWRLKIMQDELAEIEAAMAASADAEESSVPAESSTE